MANIDNPHGLRPLMRTLTGADVTVQEFTKAAGYGTAIFENDAVHRVADGSIESNTAIPGTTNYSGVSLNWSAVSTAGIHHVIVHPYAAYECQDNNSTDGLALIDFGMNANIELNAPPAPTLPGRISGHEVNEASLAVGAGLDIHLHNRLETPDNEYGAWCRAVVTFNKHRGAHNTVGV